MHFTHTKLQYYYDLLCLRNYLSLVYRFTSINNTKVHCSLRTNYTSEIFLCSVTRNTNGSLCRLRSPSIPFHLQLFTIFPLRIFQLWLVKNIYRYSRSSVGTTLSAASSYINAPHFQYSRVLQFLC